MKSFIVIGAGKFGHYFCKFLSREGAEIMIVDGDEDKLSDMLSYVSSAKVGDCTRRDVVKGLGVEDFDEAVVCVPESFQNSLQIVDLLNECGAKNITAVASTEIQAKFLLKNGADHIIFPDRDMSERLAVAIANDSIFDFLKLSDDHGIYEIIPPKRWLSQSILSVDVRRRHNVNIIAVKTQEGRLFLPGPDYVFNTEEHLILFGKDKDVEKLT
ncbi:MAG: TrkA family potassium uptake protein [Clostridia bacterium]|nr:TrkA family potassium uptake protein [Clostridia bacterium]